MPYPDRKTGKTRDRGRSDRGKEPTLKKKLFTVVVLAVAAVCIAAPLAFQAWRAVTPSYWAGRMCLTDKFQNEDGSYSSVIDDEKESLRNGKSAYTLTCTREQYEVAGIGDVVDCGREQVNPTHRGTVRDILLVRSAAP